MVALLSKLKFNKSYGFKERDSYNKYDNFALIRLRFMHFIELMVFLFCYFVKHLIVSFFTCRIVLTYKYSFLVW